MAGGQARIAQKEGLGLPGDGRAAANDEPSVLFCRDVPRFTLPEAAASASCHANDDWIEVDLPVSINVLDEEIAILDQFLRDQILALFD